MSPFDAAIISAFAAGVFATLLFTRLHCGGRK
jgi:hypothetical protein